MSYEHRHKEALWGRLARTTGWLLAVALVGLGVGWWWVGRPDRHLAEADRLLRDGQPLAALPWLRLPEATPQTAERAWLLRARIALERGRPADAVGPLEKVRAEGPNAAAAAFWKGRVMLEVGNLPHALAWFGRALQAEPENPEYLRWTASAAYDLGDLDSVIRTLQALTHLKPDDAPAWRTLGLVYLEIPEAGEGALDEAVTAYQHSLRLDPNQPTARLELAGVLVKQGQFEEASRQLDACQDRVPIGDWANLRAQVAWSRGDPESVRLILEDALTKAPNHSGLLSQQGLLAQANGQLDAAIAWFDQAIAANPYDPQSYYRRSLAARALGRIEEADHNLKQSETLTKAIMEMSALNAEAMDNPHDANVRCRLGRISQRLGKPELAASWYRAALACDPQNQEALNALAAFPSP